MTTIYEQRRAIAEEMSHMEEEIKQMKEHKSYRAMMEELSCIEEEIKWKKEYIMRTIAEEAEKEYDASAFLAKLFKETDNMYMICTK